MWSAVREISDKVLERGGTSNGRARFVVARTYRSPAWQPLLRSQMTYFGRVAHVVQVRPIPAVIEMMDFLVFHLALASQGSLPASA
ncbi:MAG: hypothetical protein AAFR35_00420 [Pseudomonadota bacterium]